MNNGPANMSTESTAEKKPTHANVLRILSLQSAKSRSGWDISDPFDENIRRTCLHQGCRQADRSGHPRDVGLLGHRLAVAIGIRLIRDVPVADAIERLDLIE